MGFLTTAREKVSEFREKRLKQKVADISKEAMLAEKEIELQKKIKVSEDKIAEAKKLRRENSFIFKATSKLKSVSKDRKQKKGKILPPIFNIERKKTEHNFTIGRSENNPWK